MLRAQVLADGLWEMDCSQSESARPDLKFRSRLNRTLICISYFVIFADPAKCVCQAVWGSTETALRQGGGGRRGDAHLPPPPTPGRGAGFSLWIIQPQLNNKSEPQGLGSTSCSQGTASTSGSGVSQLRQCRCVSEQPAGLALDVGCGLSQEGGNGCQPGLAAALGESS